MKVDTRHIKAACQNECLLRDAILKPEPTGQQESPESRIKLTIIKLYYDFTITLLLRGLALVFTIKIRLCQLLRLNETRLDKMYC